MIQDINWNGKKSYKRTPSSNMPGVAPATTEVASQSDSGPHTGLCPRNTQKPLLSFFRWAYDSEVFVFKIQKALVSTIPADLSMDEMIGCLGFDSK